MIFPIRTDRQLTRTPWVNYGLIAVNVLIFAATHGEVSRSHSHSGLLLSPEQAIEQYPVLSFFLWPDTAELTQFLSYQFLHANFMHLLSNMVFLYVFGNSIEDRLGKIAYLAFYLGGGVLAGLGHALTDSAPVLGASGAVAAVTGAYLALFPLSNVTLVYWWFFIGSFEVSSMVLIIFQILQNVVLHLMGDAGVAYMAHLSGYGYGFAVGMGLLWVRLLPREPYDLLAMIERRRRRASFKRMTQKGYQAWEGEAPKAGAEPAAASPSESEQAIMAIRQQISVALGEHNLGNAARLYLKLLELDANQVLGQQQQLDISNQLMSEGRYDSAAHAYELLLRKYKSYAQREQVELILGLIYMKYLKREDRGRQLLTAALPRLRDAQQRELAQGLLRAEQ